MSGQSGSLGVNYTSSGSGAVVADAAAVKSAIESIPSSKTCVVNIETRRNGDAAGDLGRVGTAADKASRSARDMGDNFDRAGRSARGMGDDFDRAGSNVGRAADEAERLSKHLDSVSRVLSGGAPSSTERSAAGMRTLADNADRARGSIGDVGSESSRSLGAAETGAIRAGDGMRQLGAGSGSAHQFMAGASGAAQQVSRDLVPMAQGADGVYRSVSRMAGTSKDVEKFAGSMRTIDAVGRTIDGGGSGGSGGSGGGLGGLLSKLSDLPGVATPSMAALKGVGLVAGVSALGIGALTGAVAAVGLAGVAGDFVANRQLMKSGGDAVKDFTKEFKAMKSETSASGLPAMAGVESSMKGAGHELAGIGAANMAPVLNDVASLGNQATAAMHKLEPAIAPSLQAATALGGAILGAFGDSGPAVTSFANTVTSHAPQIQAGLSSIIDVASGLGSATVDAVSAFGTVDQAVKSVVQPGGKPGLEVANKNANEFMDHITGARRDPTTGKVDSVGHWGDYNGLTGPPKAGSPAAAGYGHEMDEDLSHIKRTYQPAAGRRGGGASPGGFDASQDFSGTAVMPDGSLKAGTGSGEKAKPPKPAGYHRSPDAAKFDGMTGKQVYESQYKDATGHTSGAPAWDGLGGGRPGGPGSSSGGRSMPSAIASGLGLSGGSALPGLMQSMQSAVGGGGSQLGQAAQQHITKAVHQAGPAAAAGGASLGAAMNTGMAQGHTSTQSVVDTEIIKHSKKIIDIASAALGVHSPSTEFDFLGRMSGVGFSQGWASSMTGSFGSMGKTLTAAQMNAQKYASTYDGAPPGVTVTVPKPSLAQANQYSPTAMANIQAHNDRAAAMAAGREDRQRAAIGGMTHDERRDMLLQNRANNRERALANLGVPGHTDPMKNANPFAGDQHPSLWNTLTNEGPLGDLKAQFSKHGESMSQGVGVGIKKGTPVAQGQMSQFSKSMQNQHKKDHGIASPATVFISDGMNMALGVGVGFAGGAGAATSVMSAAAAGMSSALQGPMNDYGLQAGYTYVQAFADGASRQLKKADTQALGMPSNLSPNAMSNLATGGFLRAGSGASTWKTNSGGSSVVTLGGGPSSLMITVPGQDIVIGDEVIASIADRQIELAFNAATGTYDTL